jgi:hypothetical protein
MKQARPLRLMTFFAATVSTLISEATQAKNRGQDHHQCTEALLQVAMQDIGNTKTEQIFGAAAVVMPTVDIASVASELYRTPLEILVHQLSTMAVNDTLGFVYGVKENYLQEPDVRADPIFSPVTTRSRKVNTALAVNPDTISDALRDELSGKGVKPSKGDNDCGDSCSV